MQSLVEHMRPLAWCTWCMWACWYARTMTESGDLKHLRYPLAVHVWGRCGLLSKHPQAQRDIDALVLTYARLVRERGGVPKAADFLGHHMPHYMDRIRDKLVFALQPLLDGILEKVERVLCLVEDGCEQAKARHQVLMEQFANLGQKQQDMQGMLEVSVEFCSVFLTMVGRACLLMMY